jgi:hypothetical protein
MTGYRLFGTDPITGLEVCISQEPPAPEMDVVHFTPDEVARLVAGYGALAEAKMELAKRRKREAR